MDDDNNPSPGRRLQRKLTYQSERQQKRMSESKEHKQKARQYYQSLLSLLQSNYQEARLRGPQCEQDSFVINMKELRKVLDNYDSQIDFMYENVHKWSQHSQHTILRLQQYEVTNAQQKLITEKLTHQNAALSIKITQFNDTLEKVNRMLHHCNDQKQRLYNQVRELTILTESQQQQNRSTNKVLKSLNSEIQSLKEQISHMKFGETRMKQKHNTMKAVEENLQTENQTLKEQLDRLMTELDEKKYMLSKCISVSHNDQTDSVVSYFQIVEDQHNEDSNGDDLQCLRNVEEGYQLTPSLLQRKSTKQIPGIEGFDKLTLRDQDEYDDRQSMGRSRKMSVNYNNYIEPKSERRIVNNNNSNNNKQSYYQLMPQKQTSYNNMVGPRIKMHRRNASGYAGMTPNANKNSYPYHNVVTTPFTINQPSSYNSNVKKQGLKTLQSQVTIQGGGKNKKNVTLAYPSYEKAGEKQIRLLKQEVESKNRQIQLLKIEVKSVKREVVSKCEVITRLEGQMEMEIQQFRSRLQYEKKTFHQNSKTILKMRGNIDYLKSVVVSLVNKIYISEQLYRQVISKKCQEFLQSQCSFIDLRKAQIVSAIGRLLKFYKDYYVVKQSQDAYESQTNIKRRIQLEDIIKKLNGSDLQFIRKNRFKSSRRRRHTFNEHNPDDQIHSSKNSESFYQNMLNGMQFFLEEQGQPNESFSVRKSTSIVEFNEDFSEMSLRDKISKLSLTHEVVHQEIGESYIGVEKLDHQVQTVQVDIPHFQPFQVKDQQTNTQLSKSFKSQETQSQPLMESENSQTKKKQKIDNDRLTFCREIFSFKEVLIHTKSQIQTQTIHNKENCQSQTLFQSKDSVAGTDTKEVTQAQLQTEIYTNNLESQTELKQFVSGQSQTESYHSDFKFQTEKTNTVQAGTGPNNSDVYELQTDQISRAEVQCGAEHNQIQEQVQTQLSEERREVQTVRSEKLELACQTDSHQSDQDTQIQPKQKQNYQSQTQVLTDEKAVQCTIVRETKQIQVEICYDSEEKELQTNFQKDIQIQTQLPDKKEDQFQTEKFESECQTQTQKAQVRQDDQQTDYFGDNKQTETEKAELKNQGVQALSMSQLTNNEEVQTEKLKISLAEIGIQMPQNKEKEIQSVEIKMREMSIQVMFTKDCQVQTVEAFQVYDYKEKVSEEVQIDLQKYTNFQNKYHHKSDKVQTRTKSSKKEQGSVTSSENLAFHSEVPDFPMQIITNPQKKPQNSMLMPIETLTPERFQLNPAMTRLNHFVANQNSDPYYQTPLSTNEKSPNPNHVRPFKHSKSPPDFSNQFGLSKGKEDSININNHYELTEEDLNGLSPERIFQKLIPRAENSVFLEYRIEKLDKQHKWNKNKLYMLQIAQEKDNNPQVKKLLMWKRGLASLSDRTQLRVKPKGQMYDDLEMFTLGNSEVIARGNHIWVRRKNNRCSSVYGNFADGNWKIVSLYVYSAK